MDSYHATKTRNATKDSVDATHFFFSGDRMLRSLEFFFHFQIVFFAKKLCRSAVFIKH